MHWATCSWLSFPITTRWGVAIAYFRRYTSQSRSALDTVLVNPAEHASLSSHQAVRIREALQVAETARDAALAEVSSLRDTMGADARLLDELQQRMEASETRALAAEQELATTQDSSGNEVRAEALKVDGHAAEEVARLKKVLRQERVVHEEMLSASRSGGCCPVFQSPPFLLWRLYCLFNATRCIGSLRSQ